MSTLPITTGLLSLLADANRVRLMGLLSGAELSVAELTDITGLSQSRVSTHLGKLRDAGLLRDRRVGASTLYTVRETMAEPARKLWALIQAELDDRLLAEDRRARDQVLRARERGQPWPDAVAGRMERHYSPGRTWEAMARAFLGMIRAGDVLDVGSGDGAIAQLLAPRARTITCIDRSETVLTAAGDRLAHFANVRLVRGDMHELPFADASFDHVLLFNVLTYSSSPARAIGEAHRVLREGGDLSVTTLAEHEHDDIAALYHHVNTGFRPVELEGMLRAAGLDVQSCAISSREGRKPHFQVITAFARRPPRAGEANHT